MSRGVVQSYVDRLLRRSKRVGFAVYFVVQSEQVIYVGCTSSLTQRTRAHRKRWGAAVDVRTQCVVETQAEGERLEWELVQKLRGRGVFLWNDVIPRGGRSPNAAGGRRLVDGHLRRVQTAEDRAAVRRGIEGGAMMALIDK